MQGNLTLKNFNNVLLYSRTMMIMKKVFDEMGIRFYLKNGTLLGFLRDGFPIPYDTDVDFMTFDIIDESKFPIYRQIVDKYGLTMFKLSFDIQSNTAGMYIRSGKDEPIIAVGLEFWNNVQDKDYCITYDAHLRCPKKFFEGESRYISFMGERFGIPPDSEGFLEHNFGKSWNIPCNAGIIDGKRIWAKCDINGEMLSPLEVMNLTTDFDRRSVFLKIS